MTKFLNFWMTPWPKSFNFPNGRPPAFSWFHWIWISLAIITLLILVFISKKPKESFIHKVYLSAFIILIVFEIIKQIAALGDIDPKTKQWKFQYRTGNFPAVLCSLFYYVAPFYIFFPKRFIKTREVTLSWLTTYNLWCGSFVLLYFPNNVLVDEIIYSNHSMFHHLVLFVLGAWGAIRNFPKFSYKIFLYSAVIFTGIYILGTLGNEALYHAWKNNKLITNGNELPVIFTVSHRERSSFQNVTKGIVGEIKNNALFAFYYYLFTVVAVSLHYSIFAGLGFGIRYVENQILKLVTKIKNKKTNSEILEQNSTLNFYSNKITYVYGTRWMRMNHYSNKKK
ncbi:hypothetical protein ACJA27_03210 [Mycoplasmopsis lipophila]|uniref:hypothetical protein n=1 Tax=Mycoplasmopsis lipophila TaxID=2117 RepID=UPI0038739973